MVALTFLAKVRFKSKKKAKNVTFEKELRFKSHKHLISSGSGYPEWLNDWLIEKRPAKRGGSFFCFLFFRPTFFRTRRMLSGLHFSA